ncbi:leucine-rich repeat receptor protein kinase MSP1-like [Salvia miltiorrhiza]|uniref:leucine-rich repeat receptor protein kinase MSP1-like n=1 Tax=Salvia miltiorrhiza TaxID=226208 RepID=UPI0025AC0012|nr:leucine-rich repeat receptor protein kinase MSP1-like [Salvia miltiorrhiza]
MVISSAEQLCRRFTLAEIQSATGDFSKERLIGEGGFGEVHKGAIDDGSKMVAVKRLKRLSEQVQPEISEKLLKQGFLREIETLSKLRNRYVVSLIGFCSEQGEMILVYEYIANGTLADHLHKPSRNGRSSLTWTERLDICIGACRGLDYLHNSCPDGSIIHRDVKTSNILLDENLVPKVSDFGSAKQLNADNSESFVSTSVMFSRGYLDPCFLATGELTMASDIYAFGVVLLEVLSERRAHDDRLPRKECLLSDWANEKIRKRKAHEIVALNLRGEISKDCRNSFLGIAMRCLHPEPEGRPTITEVLGQLESALRLQQQRKMPTHRFWQFNASPKRVIPSELPHDDEVDALEHEHALNILPVATPHIPVDGSEDTQNADIPAIPLTELQDITDDFSSEYLIANGSSGGSLYRGVLKTGQVAAIKKLNKMLSDQEFLAQVSVISGLQHENVVQPLGYCMNGDLQVLAFEFASRGSLHDILHGRLGTKGVEMEPGPALSWVQRINIAVGAAKGLDYIHENALIHRSIKSSNILLFEDENAKISDVSLSTAYPCKADRGYEPYPFPLPSGCCYHPPECVLTNQTEKGDVYSFAVVLLELLTGQKPFDSTRPPGQQFLAIWATPMLSKDGIEEIVDARLAKNYPSSAVAKMAEVAALCLAKEADSRPDMSTVLRYLKKASWETRTYLQKHQQQSQRVKSALSPKVAAGPSNSSR